MQQPEGAAIAVVVATRNRGARVVPAIESILRCRHENVEVIVIDQSDDDVTRDSIAADIADERVTYVRSESIGLSNARNEGIALTSAPLIAITDDDCLVPDDWLTGMEAPFQVDPRVGVVFCSVRPYEIRSSGHTPHVIFARSRTIRSTRHAWWSARRGLCLGAGMAVRRVTFEELGGFDSQLGAGARFGALEDNDFSWRGLQAGWWTHHTNEVTVVHDGFRDEHELRALVRRDFYGVGGGAAKHLRGGHLGVLLFIVCWLVEFGVIGPLVDLAHHRRPRGFRRPLMLLRGLAAGFRTPLDRKRLLFIDTAPTTG